jgi:hypothetical protein
MPAKFDPSAVDLMRHLTKRAKPDGHLFPLAMHSGEMMPPPKSTEKSLGERRLTYFTGVGESCCPSQDYPLPGVFVFINIHQITCNWERPEMGTVSR